MTEAERLLKERDCPKGQGSGQMGSPAELYLTKNPLDDNTGGNPHSLVPQRASGNVGYRILDVIVFVVFILIGTYFARLSGPVVLGYIIGAMAFIVAPMIWRAGGR